MEKVEQEKDECLAVTGIRCVLDQAERDGAVGPDAAQLAAGRNCVFEELGTLSLKNIAEPVGAFVVAGDGYVKSRSKREPVS